MYQRRNFFCVSVLWGFRLDSGDNVIEPHLWEAITAGLDRGEPFDQAMPKERAEWLVDGSFHAPGGTPVTGGAASVTVAGSHKEIAVSGERYWGVLGASNPVPFTTMPISYRRAFGGDGFDWNSVGKGYSAVDTEDGRVHPLPNVEYPDQAVASPDDRPRPAAFGRVDVMWQPRHSYSGTYDEKYLDQSMLGLPDDIDWRFFNDAAEDQWFDGELKGDEAFEIVNMNPDRARIQGRLPGIRARCFVERTTDRDAGATTITEIPLTADTVRFFPESLYGVVIFRGTMEVAEPDGEDVRTLLAAAENIADTPRPRDHYIDQLQKRSDPEQAFKYLLDTRPLLPLGCPSELEELAGPTDGQTDAMTENMDAFVAQKRREVSRELENSSQEVAAELERHGIKDLDVERQGEDSPHAQAINQYLERALPGINDGRAQSNPGAMLAGMDLDAFEDMRRYVESVKDEQVEEGRARIQQNIEQLERELERTVNTGERESIRERIDGLKRSLEAFDAAPAPQLPRTERQIDEQIATQERSIEQAREQLSATIAAGGANAPRAEEQLRQLDEGWAQSREQLISAKAQVREQHRKTAHYMEQATSPHPGEEAEIATRLLQRYRSGESTAEGDYAFVDLSGQDLRGIDLREAYLEYADLSGCDLSEANLTGAILTHARLDGTRFRNAQMHRTNLGRSHLEGAAFERCDLREVILSYCRARDSKWVDCDLREGGFSFHQATFDRCQFEGVQIDNHTFINCDFSRCSFRNCTLNDAIWLQEPVLTGVTFHACELARASVFAAEAEDATFRDCTMPNARFMVACQLRGADFRGSNLDEATFREAIIEHADFSDTTLHQSDFSEVSATGARFERAVGRRGLWQSARLHNASLKRADLMESSLRKAVLTRADLSGANLYGVNLHYVTVGETEFRGANLTRTLLQDWQPSR